MSDIDRNSRRAILREVCAATSTLLGKPIACDRGVGHTGPHMTRESWQWFDVPEDGGESDE